MIKTVERIFRRMRPLLWWMFLRAGGVWAALSVSYNGYKQFYRAISGPLARSIRDDIKGTFPWITLVFVSVLVVLWVMRSRNRLFMPWEYVVALLTHTVIINVLFWHKGLHVIVVANSAGLLIGVFLVSRWLVKASVRVDVGVGERLLPAGVYQIAQRRMDRVKWDVMLKRGGPWIIAFMVAVVGSAFLLVFGWEKAAEDLANVGYLALVIGVGLEVYRDSKETKERSGAQR